PESWRCASAQISAPPAMSRRLPAGDASEDGPYRQAEPAEVTLPEDIACHHLPGRPKTRQLSAGPIQDPRPAIDRHAQIGEGDAGANWIGPKRRPLDAERPIALGRA